MKKHKLITILFTISMIAFSAYAVSRPSYDLGLFFNLGITAARLRILFAVALVAYVFIPFIRVRLVQIFITLAGLGILALSISSIFSPLLFGHLTQNITLGDIIMGIESGILAMVSGLELPVYKLRKLTPLFTRSTYSNQFAKFNSQKLLPAQASASKRTWNNKTAVA